MAHLPTTRRHEHRHHVFDPGHGHERGPAVFSGRAVQHCPERAAPSRSEHPEGAATVVALDHGVHVWADRHSDHARAAAAGRGRNRGCPAGNGRPGRCLSVTPGGRAVRGGAGCLPAQSGGHWQWPGHGGDCADHGHRLALAALQAFLFSAALWRLVRRVLAGWAGLQPGGGRHAGDTDLAAGDRPSGHRAVLDGGGGDLSHRHGAAGVSARQHAKAQPARRSPGADGRHLEDHAGRSAPGRQRVRQQQGHHRYRAAGWHRAGCQPDLHQRAGLLARRADWQVVRRPAH